ncbi:hypothetical protein ALO_15857, partial [Acetonema longum DSM 6540]
EGEAVAAAVLVDLDIITFFTFKIVHSSIFVNWICSILSVNSTIF